VTLRMMTDTTLSDAVIEMFARGPHFESHGTVRAEERRMADGDADRRLAMLHGETAPDVHADHWEKHPSPTRPSAA
jgi:hypothetical protein